MSTVYRWSLSVWQRLKLLYIQQMSHTHPYRFKHHTHFSWSFYTALRIFIRQSVYHCTPATVRFTSTLLYYHRTTDFFRLIYLQSLYSLEFVFFWDRVCGRVDHGKISKSKNEKCFKPCRRGSSEGSDETLGGFSQGVTCTHTAGVCNTARRGMKVCVKSLTSRSWAAVGLVSGFLSKAFFRKSLNSIDLKHTKAFNI